MEKTIGIIYAPIEIENPGQLETLGITWKDVVPIKIGNKIVKVYLVPASEEVCSYMLRQLRNKYQQEHRVSRCRVPSERGGTKGCRSSDPCLECPYYPERQSVETSLDELLEEGDPFEAPGQDPQEKAELREMLEKVGEENQLSLRVLQLYLRGYTIHEISDILDLPATTVHRHLRRARRVASEYRDDD